MMPYVREDWKQEQEQGAERQRCHAEGKRRSREKTSGCAARRLEV